MISLIDYKIGNLHNLRNALEQVGAKVHIATKPEDLKDSHKILIPGVGAFKAAMRNFENLGFKDKVIELANRGISILGICVGMQILFSESYEDGQTLGLNLIEGEVVKFSKAKKIPQIGWNKVNFIKEHPLIKEIDSGSWFYFLHSYFAKPQSRDVLAVSDYYENFCCIAVKNNLCAIQFHPEKSQINGLKLLKNFCFNV